MGGLQDRGCTTFFFFFLKLQVPSFIASFVLTFSCRLQLQFREDWIQMLLCEKWSDTLINSLYLYLIQVICLMCISLCDLSLHAIPLVREIPFSWGFSHIRGSFISEICFFFLVERGKYACDTRTGDAFWLRTSHIL